MYTSLFKREPRTNSALLIHRISKAIGENKRGGETEGNVHVYLVLSSVSRELRVPCQYTEFLKQSVKINMEEKQRETCLHRSLSVSHNVSMNLY